MLYAKYAVCMAEWMDDLLKLRDLREKGLLTEAEFEEQKKLIIPAVESPDAPTKPQLKPEGQATAVPDLPVMARKMTRREIKASIKRQKLEQRKARAEAKQQKTLTKAEAKLKKQERKGVKAQAKQLKAETKRRKREQRKAQAEAMRQKVIAIAEAAKERRRQKQATPTKQEPQTDFGDVSRFESTGDAPPKPTFQFTNPIPFILSRTRRQLWLAALAAFILISVILGLAGVLDEPEDTPNDSKPAATSVVPTPTTPEPQHENNKTNSESTLTQSQPESNSRCIENMEQAAAISEYEDTWEDTIPTFTSCSSLDEWIEAAQTAGMAERISLNEWVPNFCEYELAKLGDTPLCKSIAAAIPSELDAGWETPPASLSNPGDSKDCDDFATFVAADDWFNTYAPYYGDVARLDLNQNGFPCEDKPDAW
tara:strand:- start:78 stop:1352 length:1275 start_codon:yes stop_codon:yes gene_type:complete